MDKIVVLDFGSQYAHLICRRIREQGVYAELLPYNIDADTLAGMNPKGIVFSGGPASVYESNAPICDRRILTLGVPILGICYGHQMLVHMLGGVVKKARREYGSAELMIDDDSDLFMNIKPRIRCWMSHGDAAEALPEGFRVLAHTESSFAAAIGDRARRIYGLQFHPEVAHTEHGSDILRNFAVEICNARQEWSMSNFIDDAVRDIRGKVRDGERVLAAVSGGIDSTVTALLVHRAIGDRLTCIFVNHGLLREGEEGEVLDMFNALGIKPMYIDASRRFLERLKDVDDPEEKRLIIGEEFARVFEDAVREHGPFQWLAQGTLYPDVIESGVSISREAATIKSHHNVAGLPKWLNLKVLEPLRQLYKDEVRQVARLLGVPEHMVNRHPFPGPGLAVRIIGRVTEEKLRICRRASKIVEEELARAGWYDRVWQAFAIVGDDRAVGVLGDGRVHGHVVSIRVVESMDAMTADWARLPHELLARISNRITNEVDGVTWVTYVISSKPPATIEPQ
ncbi:MAG: glutamine-hydrolyzing GMP synthase [Candidatus Nitrosocaldus sp.]|nr:glutamine-hydrolyzing GMP synthase [Candidatus Nitrosocaldus sp.]MCS7141348.1 glutamine-hydrolyzing GMP synthase [Candidatus Nitrosocaldus sp.]MDW8000313.1 glutamine-hydrolyzing GMP synthase [Candidatus Nitrosocaldus sp.]MDW8274920.1 glutamine-hydrolyzing GMP synthase [Candidatus Nitrosocaldus sp.]